METLGGDAEDVVLRVLALVPGFENCVYFNCVYLIRSISEVGSAHTVPKNYTNVDCISVFASLCAMRNAPSVMVRNIDPSHQDAI